MGSETALSTDGNCSKRHQGSRPSQNSAVQVLLDMAAAANTSQLPETSHTLALLQRGDTSTTAKQLLQMRFVN